MQTSGTYSTKKNNLSTPLPPGTHEYLVLYQVTNGNFMVTSLTFVVSSHTLYGVALFKKSRKCHVNGTLRAESPSIFLDKYRLI